MELAVDPVVGGVPGGVCGDLDLLVEDGELGHGILLETSCRSMLTMSEMGFNNKEWEVGRVKELGNVGSDINLSFFFI
jgi:hypothetical protein